MNLSIIVRAIFHLTPSVVIGLMCGVVSLSSLAEISPIENAPAHVDGYIQCLNQALADNTWGATTVSFCQNSYPAVNALNQGDYVALTFTMAQGKIYNEAREKWVEFNKSLVKKVHLTIIPEQFSAANVRTAYSFARVAGELTARYSEMRNTPFSWYLSPFPELATSTGKTLSQLHDAELRSYSTCLTSTVGTVGSTPLSEAQFHKNAAACTSAITRINHDGSAGLYNSTSFDKISRQTWAVHLKAQTEAFAAALQKTELDEAHSRRVQLASLESARKQAEAEESNSWSVKFNKFISRIFTGLLFVGGGVAFFLFLRHQILSGRRNPAVRSSARPRHVDNNYPPSSGGRHTTQKESNSYHANFTLKHFKIGSAITRHRCASCVYWAGPRVPHPATHEMYVENGALGKCTHKHPGSPYGVKKYDGGQYCKDFSEMGL